MSQSAVMRHYENCAEIEKRQYQRARAAERANMAADPYRLALYVESLEERIEKLERERES